MKLSALLAIGALAAGGLAAVPAEAQRPGYHPYGRHDGFRGGGFRQRHDFGRGYGYGRGYAYDRGRGYGYGGGYYGRPRVTCRIVRGYYGPERRCFRTY